MPDAYTLGDWLDAALAGIDDDDHTPDPDELDADDWDRDRQTPW